MYIKINLDGKEYFTNPTDDDASAAVDEFFTNINNYAKLQIELRDKSVLILGQEHIKRATFIIVP